MDPIREFELWKTQNINRMAGAEPLASLTKEWFLESCRHKYSYNFTWLGRPIIQYPQDIVAMQEIIWQVQPDLIIETGVAHGGSLILSASLLQLIGRTGQVLGIDIDIRSHNRATIEAHPLSHRIRMIQGSSIDPHVAAEVKRLASGRKPILLILDSNHTREHVLEELRLYSPLVTKGSYLVVFDTVVENMPKEMFPDRPWGPGNSPAKAVEEFLAGTDRFVVDQELTSKLLITVAPGGYLKCVKDC